MEFIANQESLGPYMQRLVQEELVRKVILGQYIHAIPNYVARIAPHTPRFTQIFLLPDLRRTSGRHSN